MKFIPVTGGAPTLDLLYQLLVERDDHVNISHGEMPSWKDHVAFVNSQPYACWYLIEADGRRVGAVYLTSRDEIGVFVLKAFQGRGYGPKAVRMLMNIHLRKRWLANINPENERSIAMFEKLGFTPLQTVDGQVTYEFK